MIKQLSVILVAFIFSFNSLGAISFSARPEAHAMQKIEKMEKKTGVDSDKKLDAKQVKAHPKKHKATDHN